ncbi:MAG TPA: DUF1007 family protein [Xanthobacteraceae bacterium]|nr:DUF1007 family protein [Xanthobacteraceae bacterium]
MIRQFRIRQIRTIGGASAPASRGTAIAAFVAIFGLFSSAALAHPHVLITAHTEIQLNGQGQLLSITNIWDFDEAFSAFAIQGYDSNGDGILTRQELQPLAGVNMTSLADYGYFTSAILAGAKAAFGHPENYFDIFKNEKLTLQFTLPLTKPLDVRGEAVEVDVYDPAYFAAITFAQDQPVRLLGDSAGCQSFVHRPAPLDPNIASQLATIPASQRTPPPELFAITNKLINAVTVTCK